MGIDEDAIKLRNWQAQVEGRLTALEDRAPSIAPVASQSGVDVQEIIAGPIEGLRAMMKEVSTRLDAVEAKADDAVKVLTDVETALGSHAHPPSAPTPEEPPAPVNPPQAEPQAQPEAPPPAQP